MKIDQPPVTSFYEKFANKIVRQERLKLKDLQYLSQRSKHEILELQKILLEYQSEFEHILVFLDYILEVMDKSSGYTDVLNELREKILDLCFRRETLPDVLKELKEKVLDLCYGREALPDEVFETLKKFKYNDVRVVILIFKDIYLRKLNATKDLIDEINQLCDLEAKNKTEKSAVERKRTIIVHEIFLAISFVLANADYSVSSDTSKVLGEVDNNFYSGLLNSSLD